MAVAVRARAATGIRRQTIIRFPQVARRGRGEQQGVAARQASRDESRAIPQNEHAY
jgi:hypothetical protein